MPVSRQLANPRGNPVDEVLRALAGRAARDADRHLGGGNALVLGDASGLGHQVEDHGRPCRGPGGIIDRRIARRRLQQAGQQGGLTQRHFAGRSAEIAHGRGFNAIGAAPEIDPVEIEFENFVLGETAFQPEGQHHLLHLAAQGPLGRQEEVLGQLLGQCRTALDHLTGTNVCHHGPAQADHVNARVRIEAAILNRQHGIDQIGRQILDGNFMPVRRSPTGNQAALMVQERDRRGRLDCRQAGCIRQVAGNRDQVATHKQAADNDHQEKRAQPGETGPGRRCALSSQRCAARAARGRRSRVAAGHWRILVQGFGPIWRFHG